MGIPSRATRNISRLKVRSLLVIISLAISLFIISTIAFTDDVNPKSRKHVFVAEDFYTR